MKIAIVGAGFAGISAAWHLCESQKAEVVVFDAIGLGGGASGIAAGLLHPFGGPRARLNAKGVEGMEASRRLMLAASEAIGKDVAPKTGLYRLPVTEEQSHLFRENAARYPNNRLVTFLGCEALFIEEAYTVDPMLYLQGLWESCKQMGAAFEKKQISTSTELKGFDRVLIAAGASTRRLQECSNLHLKDLKGQILETSCPADTVQVPWTANAYVVPQQNKGTCIIGATFERNFETIEPQKNFAADMLLPEVCRFNPAFSNVEIIECRAGVRATAPGYYPLCLRLSERCWTAVGLGSKGLLYHGLLGSEAALALLNT